VAKWIVNAWDCLFCLEPETVMKYWMWGLATVIAMAGIATASVSWWALQKTRVVPDFYARATQRLPEDLDSAVARLERDMVQLQGDASRLGSWQAVFTDEQINAWLVQQLPREFPQLLPPGVIEPRIIIEDGRVLVAARFKNPHLDTVISFELKAALTEHANVVAIQVNNLRAGTLPLPLERFLRGISREAAKSNMEVRWDMDQSDPIALVTIPSDHPNYIYSPVIVESVFLAQGILALAGHTGQEAREAYNPCGPIYQLASARVGRSSRPGANEIRQASDEESRAVR
jgi:hypothetical protein